MLGNPSTSFHCWLSGTTWGSLVWKPLTSRSGRLYFHWMTQTQCPCWQASALLKCSRARPRIRVSCRGAALSLTLTSELPGLVEKRWKNFPVGINKTISLKHCDTFLAWVVLEGIICQGLRRPKVLTISSMSLFICSIELRAVRETSSVLVDKKQEKVLPG